MRDSTPEQLAAGVLRGERRAVARALNLVEDRRMSMQAQAHELLDRLHGARTPSQAHLIGLTGPPGVGKSTLAASLMRAWRATGLRVAVLAVDPSSSISGGALLGDRLRMLQPVPDNSVFIRSLAGRGELGGLSAETYPMSQVLLAAFDIVLIETIGVGQTEIDVVLQTDTTCFVAQPGAGDIVQYLKAGILELPGIVVINKADLGGLARHTAHELRSGLSRSVTHSWDVPVLLLSATRSIGITALIDAFHAHRAWLERSGCLLTRRDDQALAWGLKRFTLEFGQHGVAQLGGRAALIHHWQERAAESPYRRLAYLRQLALDRLDRKGRNDEPRSL